MSPVITAHPTEVRRKTVLEVLDELSDLLDELDLRRDDAAPLRGSNTDLSVCVLLLWQTALLAAVEAARSRRDQRSDPVLRHQPVRGDPRPDAGSGRRRRRRSAVVAASTPRVRSRWGRGSGAIDDGNPFVTADVVRYATGRQIETALAHHLGRAPPPVTSAVDDRPPGLARAPSARTRGRIRRRLAVPRRRAVPAGAARDACAAARIRPARARDPTSTCPARRRSATARRTPISPNWSPTSIDVIDVAARPWRRTDRRCAGRAGASSVAIFGAHLCGLDLRQNSAVHEEVLADLFCERRGLRRLPRASPRPSVSALLTAELRNPRLLRHPGAELAERTRIGTGDPGSGRRRCGPGRPPDRAALRDLDGPRPE